MNILHVDSRQLQYHKQFGDISTDVPAERLFIYQNIIEAPGAVTCVAISGCKARSSQTGKEYDFEDSFNFAPHTSTGMYPPDWFGSVVKRGLKIVNSVLFDTDIKSYWRADTGGAGDAFDNVISAMNHANSACTVWSTYYSSWNTEADVLPQGSGRSASHDWVIAGWKVVNGVTMLIVDFHTGRTYFMPREVFNVEISRLGCGTGIPATVAIAAIERRSLMQYIIDLCQNTILLLRQLQLFGTFPPTSTELAWDTRGNCSHSVRVIADEVGMTVEQKNIFWACIRQESNFDTQIIHQNKNGKGVVLSTDYGICQINDFYHIGEGKDFATVTDVLTDPEADVRWMAKCFQEGHASWWVSFSSGAYKQHLPYTPIQ